MAKEVLERFTYFRYEESQTNYGHYECRWDLLRVSLVFWLAGC
jgi:hypothetical protein